MVLHQESGGGAISGVHRWEAREAEKLVMGLRPLREMEVIEEELQKLVRSSLDGVRVFHTLYRHRVALLAKRSWSMWRYDGLSDPNRASSEELPDDEV